jgi:hypothetical protein
VHPDEGDEAASAECFGFGTALNEEAGRTLVAPGTQTLTLFNVTGLRGTDFFDTIDF